MATIRSYNKRLEALRSERSSFIPIYRDLSDYHLAHRGRFLSSDRNKGYKRNTRQYNNSSRMAVRTLASGMLAGITSPARPWFQLSTGDASLDSTAAVKQWLHQVQKIMYRVFAKSNFYNSMHNVYAELGVFGTAPMAVYHDFQNVIRCKPFTAGSYMIAADGTGRIDTLYREYEITVAEVVKQFGIENCSTHVTNLWEKGNTETWIKIVHVVEPNDDRDMQSPLSSDKPIRSVYYEYDQGNRTENKFLRQSGFDDSPIMVPRWEIAGEDIYATDCPGMTCLGDTKALQLAEKRKYQAIDKMSNPQLAGPASLINKMKRAGVGGHVATDSPGDALTSVYGNWRPDLNAIKEDIGLSEERISRAFYEDLFLMISMSDRRQITAREIAEKHEEKLLMLGPVLERLHDELLDPVIDRTFNILARAGVLPPAPESLQERELEVEYVSVLAQAQRMVSVTGVERLVGFTAEMTNIWPEARNKVDANQVINEYAESVGVNPSVVRGDDESNEMTQQQNQAAAAQEAQAAAAQMAQTAKTASETDVSGDSALNELLQNSGLQ